MSEPASRLVVVTSGDEPVVLAGPPGELTGRVLLHNPGDANVVVRDAGLTDPSGVLGLRSPRQRLAPVVLRPDQGGALPLSIAVDPATPPGEYHTELDLGGHSRPAVLHVTETVELSVAPASLVVANRPGVPQRKRLIVANRGNVALTLGEPADVAVREDLPRDLARPALGAWPDRQAADVEAIVVAVLAAAREAPPPERIQVRAPGGAVDVRPGETVALELEITVPDGLPPGRRYLGRLPVLTEDVDLLVVSGGPVEPEPPAPPRRRARASSRSPTKRGGRS